MNKSCGWYSFLIAAAVLLVFANSLNNAFVLDDPVQITNNPNVKSLDLGKLFLGSTFAGGAGLSGVYYKPLMTSTHAVIYRLGGENPFGFHLIQLILHIANSILVYCIFMRVFNSSRLHSVRLHPEDVVLKRKFPGKLALFLALIFALHPLNSESVVYISALQEPLFFFFGALGFLIVITSKKLNAIRLAAFGVLIFLSLLSKEAGVLFLGVPVVYVFLLVKKEKGNFQILKILGLTGFIFVTYLVLRYMAVGLPLSPDNPYPIMRISLIWRILTIPREIFYYIRNFFFPWDIAIAQHWVVTSLRFDNFYWPLLFDSLFFGSILAFGKFLISKDEKHYSSSEPFDKIQGKLRESRSLKGSSRPFDLTQDKQARTVKTFIFFFIWFLLGLGLHLNLFPLDATVADRWFYFPMVGLLGIFGVAILSLPGAMNEVKGRRSNLILRLLHIRFSQCERFARNDKKEVCNDTVLVLLGILIIAALSVRTIMRNSDWRDGLTLAIRDIKYSRESFPLENNLAFELIGVKRFDEALVHAEESTRLGPHWWLNWNNLGVVYRHKAMTDSAYTQRTIEAFRKSTENTDTFYMPYENLAEFLLFYISPEEASVFIIESSKKLDLNARLLFLLAVSEYQLGDSRDALILLASTKQLVPNDQTVAAFYDAILNGQKVEFEKPNF